MEYCNVVAIVQDVGQILQQNHFADKLWLAAKLQRGVFFAAQQEVLQAHTRARTRECTRECRHTRHQRLNHDRQMRRAPRQGTVAESHGHKPHWCAERGQNIAKRQFQMLDANNGEVPGRLTHLEGCHCRLIHLPATAVKVVFVGKYVCNRTSGKQLTRRGRWQRAREPMHTM